MKSSIALAGTILLVLTACSKESPTPNQVNQKGFNSTAAASLPDVGKIDSVKVESVGEGATLGKAVNNALRSAIQQVNGTSLQAISVVRHLSIDMTSNNDAAFFRSSGFAQEIIQKSGGIIDHFSITDISKPFFANGTYTVKIEAFISKFKPSSLSEKKLKIVIAPIQATNTNYTVGTMSISASQLTHDIAHKISLALASTGRFSVLDRQDSADFQQEINLIHSGQTPASDTAKLGQVYSADVILAGSIGSFSYIKHAQSLITSDRKLVSYTGHWSYNQKLINFTTREIMNSSSLAGTPPSIAPTTLPITLDSRQILENMENNIAQKAVHKILATTFPISVISKNHNNIVLSQGGDVLHAGDYYSMSKSGDILKDPQTGEIIGRAKSKCCDVVINRVDQKFAYAHIVKRYIPDSQITPDGSVRIDHKIKAPTTVTVAKQVNPVATSTDKSNEIKPTRHNIKSISLPSKSTVSHQVNNNW